MANRTRTITDVTDQAVDAAQRTREAIDEAAAKAKHRAREFAQEASDKADESRATAAEALRGASDTLHDAAESIPSETVSDIAHSAAERLEQGARYIEEHDTGELIQDLLTVVRRHPVPALLVAGSCGFMLARSFRKR